MVGVAGEYPFSDTVSLLMLAAELNIRLPLRRSPPMLLAVEETRAWVLRKGDVVVISLAADGALR